MSVIFYKKNHHNNKGLSICQNIYQHIEVPRYFSTQGVANSGSVLDSDIPTKGFLTTYRHLLKGRMTSLNSILTGSAGQDQYFLKNQ